MKRNTTGTTGRRIKVSEGEIIKFESMPQGNWGEQFDKLLDQYREGEWNNAPLLDFIQSLLDQQKKELLGKIDLNGHLE